MDIIAHFDITKYLEIDRYILKSIKLKKETKIEKRKKKDIRKFSTIFFLMIRSDWKVQAPILLAKRGKTDEKLSKLYKK